MELVVGGDRGTARRWSSLPARFAGKTGTSQVIRKVEGVKWYELPWEQRHHALFVGYAPPEAPTLVVAVVVEHGGDAAAVAAPVAARIVQKAFAPGFDTTTIRPNLPADVDLLPADASDEPTTLQVAAVPATTPPAPGGARR
jgi:penicillin-binding protein 2